MGNTLTPNQQTETIMDSVRYESEPIFNSQPTPRGSFYGSSPVGIGDDKHEEQFQLRMGWENDEQVVPSTSSEPQPSEGGEKCLAIDESAQKTDDIEEAIFPEGEYAFKLGRKGRFAVIQNLGFCVYVSIREHFHKLNQNGVMQWYPTKKGIHLRKDEWDELLEQMNRIDNRVNETEKKLKLKMRQLEKRFVKRSGNVPYMPQKMRKRIHPTPIDEASGYTNF